MKYLQHIRKKSKRAQARIAFVVAALSALVVTMLWVPTLPDRLSRFDKATADGLRNAGSDTSRVGESVDSEGTKADDLTASLAETFRKQKAATTTNERVKIREPQTTDDTKATSSIRFIE